MRFSLFAVTAVLMLSGCNTYYQSTFEKIMVRTPGVEEANCTLTTETPLHTEQNEYNVMTPRLVVVERSRQPLTVICEKTGYYTASVIVKPKTRATAASLNVFNGFVPGMAYDVASNSIYDYPDTIIVTLLPLPPEKPEPQPAPYTLQKKAEDVKPEPSPSAPPAAAADKSLSQSLKK